MGVGARGATRCLHARRYREAFGSVRTRAGFPAPGGTRAALQPMSGDEMHEPFWKRPMNGGRLSKVHRGVPADLFCCRSDRAKLHPGELPNAGRVSWRERTKWSAADARGCSPDVSSWMVRRPSNGRVVGLLGDCLWPVSPAELWRYKAAARARECFERQLTAKSASARDRP